MPWSKLLGVAAGGALGGVARFALSSAAHRISYSLPLGTLAVNLLGCLLFGLVWSAFEGRVPVASAWRTAVFVGFLGSFTTFSTLAFETHHLGQQGLPVLALANLAVHVVAGWALVAVGLWLGRLV